MTREKNDYDCLVEKKKKQACCPDTPLEELLELAHDSDAEVRRALLDNTSAPDSVLEILARDPYPDIRIGVAKHENANFRIHAILSQDRNPFVRFAVPKYYYL